MPKEARISSVRTRMHDSPVMSKWHASEHKGERTKAQGVDWYQLLCRELLPSGLSRSTVANRHSQGLGLPVG
jgi:hypothetical protein